MVRRHRDRDREWDLFLSYPSADRDAAEALYQRLHAKARVFLDEKTIPPGEGWSEAIDDAIRHSMVIAVIVSGASDRAYFQKEESLRALDETRTRGAVVVPVLIGDARGARALPFGLTSKQAIMARDADAAAQSLLQVVERESQSESGGFRRRSASISRS